jgi:DNA processing protein
LYLNDFFAMDEYLFLWAQWGALDFKRYEALLKCYGDLKTAWKRVNKLFFLEAGYGEEKAQRLMEIRGLVDFQRVAEWTHKSGTRLFFYEDADFPSALKLIPNPPVFLFVQGQIPAMEASMAVVGTRRISSYGRAVTERFTRQLVEAGYSIISGLALGVDTVAHRTALECGGVTVAVLAGGLDTIHPSRNTGLARRILESGGALASEYPLGSPSLPHHFPIRNRLVSGLSRGVLVTEAGLASGTYATVRYALDQGRGTFGVPVSAGPFKVSGVNAMIRNVQLKLVESVEDILEDPAVPGENPARAEPVPLKKTDAIAVIMKEDSCEDNEAVFPEAEAALKSLLGSEGVTLDELVDITSINVSRLMSLMIRFQLAGAVREIGGRWFSMR